MWLHFPFLVKNLNEQKLRMHEKKSKCEIVPHKPHQNDLGELFE